MHMILYEINLAQVSLLYYIKVFKFDRFYQLSTNLLNPDWLLIFLRQIKLFQSRNIIHIFNQILRFLSFLSIMMLVRSSTSPNYISYVYVIITS